MDNKDENDGILIMSLKDSTNVLVEQILYKHEWYKCEWHKLYNIILRI